MTSAAPDPAVVLRGAAVGAFTATLAVAAHGGAGGGLPGGSLIALLAVLSATLGALAATLTRAQRTSVLWGLLGAGQLMGHALLSVADHSHAAVPGAVMALAHLAAVTTGAVLIGAGSRLCNAVTRVVRVATSSMPPVPTRTSSVVVHRTDQPSQSTLFLAGSVSHRGPPVGACA